MHRSIRTLHRLLVAIPIAATLVVAGAGGASAAVIDPGSTGITLDTTIQFIDDSTGNHYLEITADGTFTSSFVENTTLALQIVGTETWTDSAGTHTSAIDQTPSSIQFASTNSIGIALHVHANSIVQVSYTAEDVGFAPTPFTGSCTGTGVRLGENDNTTTKTC
jgi:hypothetical protein